MRVRWVVMEDSRVDLSKNMLSGIMDHSSFAIAIICKSYIY